MCFTCWCGWWCVGGGVGGSACDVCGAGVDVFGGGFGVECLFVGGVGGGWFGGGGVVCVGVGVVVVWGCCVGCWFLSFPVSFPETDGSLLWGNMSPISFPETAGGLLSGKLPRLLRMADPQHNFVFES